MTARFHNRRQGGKPSQRPPVNPYVRTREQIEAAKALDARKFPDSPDIAPLKNADQSANMATAK